MRSLFFSALACSFLGLVGCSPASSALQNKGSDTMLEVASAWAEAYDAADVEVSGGGSGVGISALINGTVDIANSSRKIKAKEIDGFKKNPKNAGKEPVEFIVGYDALAVYVHKDNPLDELTLDQLKQIYAENGSITKWSQLGVKVPGCEKDQIICIRRANSSGTYVYFKEAVLGKTGEYRLECAAATGSRDLVLRIGNTPCAIGYSGMGYKTDDVKFVKIKQADGAAAIGPSVAAVHAKTYPIARPLFMYTSGQPEGQIKAYLDWIRSDVGQDRLEAVGYVSLTKDERVKATPAAPAADPAPNPGK